MCSVPQFTFVCVLAGRTISFRFMGFSVIIWTLFAHFHVVQALAQVSVPKWLPSSILSKWRFTYAAAGEINDLFQTIHCFESSRKQHDIVDASTFLNRKCVQLTFLENIQWGFLTQFEYQGFQTFFCLAVIALEHSNKFVLHCQPYGYPRRSQNYSLPSSVITFITSSRVMYSSNGLSVSFTRVIYNCTPQVSSIISFFLVARVPNVSFQCSCTCKHYDSFLDY